MGSFVKLLKRLLTGQLSMCARANRTPYCVGRRLSQRYEQNSYRSIPLRMEMKHVQKSMPTIRLCLLHLLLLVGS